jgi:hypothetical protein
VEVKINMDAMSGLSNFKEVRVMVQFMEDPISKISAWAPYLGYQKDTIFKEFPCVILGLAGVRIRCDLYTFTSSMGPYNNLHINSDITGPFFIVYGFNTPFAAGTVAKIELPRIKIGTMVNVPAWVKVSILEETPAQL